MKIVLTFLLAALLQPQDMSFEVATIKLTPPDYRGGRFATMQSAHQFIARNYTVKYMISAAYTLPMRAITGGPDWVESQPYDITALTPGEARPTTVQQWSMLRSLLADRFKLKFHFEPKEQSAYVLTTLNKGASLKESAAPADAQPDLVNRVFPASRVLLPARNATIKEFAAMMGRAVLGRPVLDRSGLSGRYDFDLEWTYDDSQFDGLLPQIAQENIQKPDLFAALQQLGLKLESSRAQVDTIVIDSVERPSEN